MSSQWVLQHNGYGLGNFVMATPALKLLADRRASKVDVFFQTASISELYRDCPFINVLNKKPKNKPFFTIRMVKRKKHESDSEALCRILLKNKFKMPHTYIDTVSEFSFDKKNKKCVSIFHGCLGKIYKDKKDIGVEARQYIIDQLSKEDVDIILIGTNRDGDRYWGKNNLKNVKNYLGKHSLRKSVGILNSCDCFISNDTGLYHVAGALRKKGLVCWKKTNHIKNMSPFDGITHSRSSKGYFDVYKKDIDNFIKRIIRK